MKKALFLSLFLFLFSTLATLGQDIAPKNSLRLGVNLMTIRDVNTIGPHYQARYARHLMSDRLLVGLSLGYFHQNVYQYQGLKPELFTDKNKLRRLTTDLSVLVDLLPSDQTALRVGGGLSYWFQSDQIVTGGSYSSTSTGETYNIQTDWIEQKGWNSGYHLTLEYEKKLNSHLSIDGSVGWVDIARSQSFSDLRNRVSFYRSVQAGLSVGYMF
ncbi:hypothetical protein [Spirosoma utsteinense]|uniref:Outer membrane protein beta-barrel domain-containing protein n=1 Tax=Spirosoma utsteinense TaxID=2585773 RepID=A0ABR6W8L2_9BACT|nr:hypothetical protein [Spirosoma utsteinense]MBC3789062.1 hypothetical protein [Spirosoma utsteinense]MBC3792130.1 hypothetical protein [Spirosoma utsteinense]